MQECPVSHWRNATRGITWSEQREREMILDTAEFGIQMWGPNVITEGQKGEDCSS